MARRFVRTGQLSPEELERAYSQAHVDGAPCRHDVEALCTGCGTDLAEALRRACNGWGYLWRGTLEILRRQEHQAYRRLLAAWGRHELVGYSILMTEAPSPRRHRRRSRVKNVKLGREFLYRDRTLLAQLPLPPVGPAAVGLPASDEQLAKYQRFADDQKPVKPVIRPIPPGVLVHEFYKSAERYLRKEKGLEGAGLRKGALDLIRERLFSNYTVKTLEKLAKRGRRETHFAFDDGLMDGFFAPEKDKYVGPNRKTGSSVRHDIHVRFSSVRERAERKHTEHLAQLRPSR
jgi:hypothetical protein